MALHYFLFYHKNKRTEDRFIVILRISTCMYIAFMYDATLNNNRTKSTTYSTTTILNALYIRIIICLPNLGIVLNHIFKMILWIPLNHTDLLYRTLQTTSWHACTFVSLGVFFAPFKHIVEKKFGFTRKF